MRVVVVSDIHGNLAALEAVLEVASLERPDEIWCLGDLTGYGAKPNECVDLMRETADVCLAGNHDLVVRGDLDIDQFSLDAALAAHWAREVLGDDQRAWLRTLSPVGTRQGVSLFHASIRDPIWEYVLTEDVALACLNRQQTPLALIGHSHVALELALNAGDLLGGLARSGEEVKLDGTQLLNPGSVGQPRDRDPRAAWLVLDFDKGQARFHRTAYDIKRTQREIREAGLPERLADRLDHGL